MSNLLKSLLGGHLLTSVSIPQDTALRSREPRASRTLRLGTTPPNAISLPPCNLCMLEKPMELVVAGGIPPRRLRLPCTRTFKVGGRYQPDIDSAPHCPTLSDLANKATVIREGNKADRLRSDVVAKSRWTNTSSAAGTTPPRCRRKFKFTPDERTASSPHRLSN